MMKENTEHCCCEGCDSSPETLLGRIGELASEYRGKEGSLISVLHMAQGLYGYLPLEVQRTVADALDIPLSEVSGVVSFYDEGPEVYAGGGAMHRRLRSGPGDVH